MKLVIKVFAWAVALAVFCALGFALWGDWFERLFSQEACVQWFAGARPYAWAIGIALLIGDLLLPVPATGVMAALGAVYGWAFGTLFSIAGSMAAGTAGYLAARLFGQKAATRLASADELDRFRRWFDRWGAAAIIPSRALPILPEVTSVLAGMAAMDFSRFLISLALGTVPTCALFAYVGHASRDIPAVGIAAAALLPLAIWPLAVRLIQRSAA